MPPPQKGDQTVLDSYRSIALMNNLLKLWTALIKNAYYRYAQTYGILSEKQDGFRILRIHIAMVSIIIMMEDAKIYNKDICTM
jgi:hypothetical protein